MKRKISKITLFVGFVVTMVGILLDSLISDGTITLSVTGVMGYSPTILAALLGTCFIFAQNRTLIRIGYALSAFAGIRGLLLLISGMTAEQFTITGFGLTLILIASLLYFIHICVVFFGYSKGNREDDLPRLLAAYKSLEKDNIISADEFAALKVELLSRQNNNDVSLSDLRQWKKLQDQGILTEEEFSALKAKLFSR